MHRFLIPGKWLTGDGVIITGEQAHQIRDVLRFKPGDTLAVIDNSGYEYETVVMEIEKGRVTGKVLEKRLSNCEPSVEVILYQALLKGNRIEDILHKCTELGVSGFVPLLTERCVVNAPGKTRLTRWEKILTESTEQCGRSKIPELSPAVDFRLACREADGASLISWEKESTLGIKTALKMIGKAGRVNVFVGPEGGFTPSEVSFAFEYGVTPVAMGKRTLRADTAGIVVTAIILYEMNELSI